MTTAPLSASDLRPPATARVCGVGDESSPTIDQFAVQAALGLKATELRTVASKWVHELTRSEWRDVVSSIRASGLSVIVVDTPVGGQLGDAPARESRQLVATYAEAACELNCSRLRVMSKVPSPPGAEDGHLVAKVLADWASVAASYGVRLLHENCTGWAFRDPQRAKWLLDQVGRDRLGLLFDVGNGLAHGYTPSRYLEPLLGDIEHVHIKDGLHMAESVLWTTPGTGVAGVEACINLLHDSGYSGWFSVEPHIDYMPGRTLSPSADQMAQSFSRCVSSTMAMVSRHGVAR